MSRILLCASLIIPTSGCGFIFSHGPPAGHEKLDYIPCTESNAAPIIDVVWGSLNVLGALGALADRESYDNPDQIVVVGLSWGVISGFAAASGFKKSSQCQRARHALGLRQAARGGGILPVRGVDSAMVQAVTIVPSLDTLAVGERTQLVATAHSSSGATISNRVFTWSSSNDAIASVSNAGLVSAHAAGSVIIAANTNNVVGTATVVVTAR